jgi:heme exporter protein C
LWAATAGVLAVGIYLSFFVAPPDRLQGEMVRIMFIHVPFAWLSMACFAVMAVASLGTLVWRHPLADVCAKAATPIGAAFTFLALVTGALWGRPTWGAYWVWDARLTSVLILFLIYLGLIALRQAVEDPGRAARAAAILTLVGSVNIPIIKFSVDWWNTLHQGESILRIDGPSIHPSMLWPLLVMALAMTLLFAALLLMAMRNEVHRRRVRALELAAAASAATASAATASAV